MDPDSLAKAMVGQDIMVLALGISDNPIAVRLLRRAGAPLDVRSRGTARVVDTMRAEGVRRLVVQSTQGISDTYAALPRSHKLFVSLIITPQVTDHERQEELVRSSGLEWTLVRPVFPHDADTTSRARVGLDHRVDS